MEQTLDLDTRAMKYLMDPNLGVNPALMIHGKISHTQTPKQAVKNKMCYNEIVLTISIYF